MDGISSRCWANCGGRRHGLAGVEPRADGPGSHHRGQFAAKGVDRPPIALRNVLIDKRRLAQRHQEAGRASIHQFLPMRNVDVVRLDLQQHLAVEAQRPFGREPRDRVAEAPIGVAALEVVMEPSGVESLLQRGVLRVLPDGVLVVRQGLAPPPLLFQLLAAAEHLGDLAAGVGDGDRGGKLGDRGSGKKKRQCRQARAKADWKDPSSHGVVRRGWGCSPETGHGLAAT